MVMRKAETPVQWLPDEKRERKLDFRSPQPMHDNSSPPFPISSQFPFDEPRAVMPTIVNIGRFTPAYNPEGCPPVKDNLTQIHHEY